MNVLASILSSLIFVLLDCECCNLENISTQDILSNGINENDQIIGKFVTLIKECASNFETYKAIELDVEKFPYHPIFFQIGFSNKTILFEIISDLMFIDNIDQPFTTSVECDSSGIGEIRVSLPPTIRVEARFIIQSRENNFEVSGQFSYKMENSALIRLSNVSNNEWNSESNVKHRLVYATSEVELDTGREDHKMIYQNLHSFISSMELSLENHLAKQLNAELMKRKATITTFSKFVKPNQPNRLEPAVVASALVDNKAFLNKLYIIPANKKLPELSPLSLYILQILKLKFGQIITLDPNLIIVEGLSNFTNVKTTFAWVIPPGYCNIREKDMIVRIKSGILSGKCTLICCIKANDTEISRNIEFLFKANSAEIEILDPFLKYDSQAYSRRSFEIRIHLKEMQIKTKLPNAYCENMSKSVQNVLNDYLELAIRESLKKSIRIKIQNSVSL